MNITKTLKLNALADVESRQVRWLLHGLIPLRTITLVAGVGGLGKSTWLAGVAACVTRGEVHEGEPGDVILISYEDPAAEVLRPRVEAAGGDLTRVHEIASEGLQISLLPEACGVEPVQFPSDIGELERLVREVKARLIVIDPVVASIDTTYDAHKDQDVRNVLGKLAALAEKESCAIVLVGHLNKAASTEAYLRIGGSTAFWNAARSVILVTEDPEDPTSGRLVGQRKANYARVWPVQRHRIEEVTLPQSDPETGKPIVTSKMTFLEVADEIDSGDLLRPRAESDARIGRPEALRFLLDALDDGEWHKGAELKERAAGHGISDRTLKRAMEDLDVEYARRGFPSVTWWRRSSRATLPATGPESAGPTMADDANALRYAQLEPETDHEELVGPVAIETASPGLTVVQDAA